MNKDGDFPGLTQLAKDRLVYSTKLLPFLDKKKKFFYQGSTSQHEAPHNLLCYFIVDSDCKFCKSFAVKYIAH
jgi:hypothetical protein